MGPIYPILADIQHSLNHADAASRELAQRAENEAQVQKWLAEQLEWRCRNLFSVHREVEVADDKEPDIVVASTTPRLEVAIEVQARRQGLDPHESGIRTTGAIGVEISASRVSTARRS